MEEDFDPKPFERRRNLSSRNFEKLGFSRRQSSASNCSFETRSLKQDSFDSTGNDVSTSSSSFQLSYSVNSDTENGFREKSLQKLKVDDEPLKDTANDPETPSGTADPALLDVKQKVKRFETLKADESIIFKVGRHFSKSTVSQDISQSFASFIEHEQQNEQVLANPVLSSTLQSTYSSSIDEEKTEDDVDNFSDSEEDDTNLEEGVEAEEEVIPVQQAINEQLQRSISSTSKGNIKVRHTKSRAPPIPDGFNTVGKDFMRNYRSKERPNTQVIVATAQKRTPEKFNSVYDTSRSTVDSHEEEAELRSKGILEVEKILEELLDTERKYVQTLIKNFASYGTIFNRPDLPDGLRGKKYDLFGNIEQIIEFHRDEFLPMMERNSNDLQKLFDDFRRYIDENCFYSYVLYTMNKKASLKLCAAYEKYFKLIQNEIGDRLGINSFLVEPIQRLPRYSLFLNEFIKKLFSKTNYQLKPILQSCCSLELKVRNVLNKANDSESVNDIVNCHEVDIHLQGKFCKVDEFSCTDQSLRRTYRSKVFIFDKCIIYTEIKDSKLLFRGRYPCEYVGINPKPKCLTLYYEKPKQQECDFHADQKTIEVWIELIKDMVIPIMNEERLKLQELYSSKSDHAHRKPPSLSLYRDSNRFSSDSGIGNIWALPKPEIEETVVSPNRTTWYTDR